MFVGSVAVGVGGAIFAGDVADRVVVVIHAVRTTDRIQPVEIIVGVVQGFIARPILDLADIAIVLVGVGDVEAGKLGERKAKC